MHVVVANNIYPPIMAGGAELIVAWLSEGLAARGHRVTVVSTCGPEMQPYPVETVNGVTVIRFFPRNVYWNFAREGQPSYRRALWHLRDAWNRDAGRRFRAVIADAIARHRAHASDRWLLRGDLAPRAPRRHSDRPHRARLPSALSARLHADARLEDLPQAAAWRAALYRAWHLATARDVDLFVSPSRFLLEQHRAAGLPAIPTAVVPNGIPLPHGSANRRRGRADVPAAAPPDGGKGRARRAAGDGCVAAHARLPAGDRRTRSAGGRDAPGRRDDPRIRFVGYVTGEAKQALLEQARLSAGAVALVRECAGRGHRGRRAWRRGRSPAGSAACPSSCARAAPACCSSRATRRGLPRSCMDCWMARWTLADQALECRNLAEQHTVDRMVDGYLSTATGNCWRHVLRPTGRARRARAWSWNVRRSALAVRDDARCRSRQHRGASCAVSRLTAAR